MGKIDTEKSANGKCGCNQNLEEPVNDRFGLWKSGSELSPVRNN
jgi:hypothetical protein